MNGIIEHLNLWLDIDTEPFMVSVAMSLLAAYVLTQILRNVALGIGFYPVLLASSIISIGVGTQYGLVGNWYSSMVGVLAAIWIGMSVSTMMLLCIIAIYNRATS
ncbi:MAG: hypothetical protein ACREDW_05600 [Aestuariivirgaceae bacterium]